MVGIRGIIAAAQQVSSELEVPSGQLPVVSQDQVRLAFGRFAELLTELSEQGEVKTVNSAREMTADIPTPDLLDAAASTLERSGPTNKWLVAKLRARSTTLRTLATESPHAFVVMRREVADEALRLLKQARTAEPLNATEVDWVIRRLMMHLMHVGLDIRS